ncbi:MAG: restriction endonuclease subunit S [Clostridia bacterium]|nr:restriction endonuclease subunit S [Clostridia bacterium]
MIDVQALKLKVLRLALSGQLLYSDDSDISVDELIATMQAQKAHLVKTKKIRADKLPDCIDESMIPFPIPSYWKWMYLGDVFYHNTGKALDSTDTQGKKLTYITTSNLYWDRFVLEDLRSMYFTDDEIEKCSAIKGDLLVCEGGDYGRAAIWDKDYPIRLQNHIHKLRPYVETCIRFYYYVFFYYKFANMIHGKGIGLEGLSTNKLHQLLIPLPPYEEQKRIVEHVDKAFAILDRINVVQAEYTDNLEALREAIVTLGITGKLVNSSIDWDDVSNSKELWEVTIWDKKFNNVDKAKQKKTIKYKYALASELQKMEDDTGTVFLLSTGGYKGYTTEEKAGDYLHDGEVVAIPWGGSPVIKYYKGRFVTSDNRIATSSDEKILLTRYLYYFFVGNYRFLKSVYRGTGLEHPEMSKILNMNITLPPVEEQKRIVDRLDSMLSIFDSMTVR